MIVNNNYHHIACKCSDDRESKNKHGFFREHQENNGKSTTFASKAKKSFAQSITASPDPNLSIKTHVEERTRNGSLPCCDLYVERQLYQKERETKKPNVKPSSYEAEDLCDFKNKNGFRNSFRAKYFNGFNRSKRKSKKAAKKAKLELLDDVSTSAAKSDVPPETQAEVVCDKVPESEDAYDEERSHPCEPCERDGSDVQDTPEPDCEVDVLDLESLRQGKFNETIVNMVTQRRKTNLTDLLKCKCLERNLNDFQRFLSESSSDRMVCEMVAKYERQTKPTQTKSTENVKVVDTKSNAKCHQSDDKVGHARLVVGSHINKPVDLCNKTTQIDNKTPERANDTILSPQETRRPNSEQACSEKTAKESSTSVTESVKNFVDVSSRRVKDVIQLFEAAAQRHVEESRRNKPVEKPEQLLLSESLLGLTQQKPIANKQILDKKTLFQRLSSWPLLKPRNKVVRRATPMKTLNQLRQHLTAESDVESVADSEADADSECTESSATLDREDCESSVSKTSVTYCTKVQLKSFQHIIEDIEGSGQVSVILTHFS